MKTSIFGLIVIVGLFSCKSDVQTESEADVLKVTVQQAREVEKMNHLQFPGKVIADDKMILSTKIIGQIEQVFVEEGDQVKKGQLLVKIRNNDILSKKAAAKASLKEAKSSLKNTQRNYERTQRLFERGSATQKELDDITTANEVGKARVESISQSIVELNELLTYSNLKSPINGFVSQKFANKGTMATPGSPLIAIESLDQLMVEINVPEFEIGFFEEEDIVLVEVDALGERKLDGFVHRIITSSAFTGLQYQVLVRLKENDIKAKPGMFARVNLLKNTIFKTLVPNKAIVRVGQLSGLYTVNEQGEAMLRWVRLGKQYPDGIEVLSGLVKGEQFIVASESRLSDGIKVEITKNI